MEFEFLPPVAVNEFFGILNPVFPAGTFINIVATVDSNATGVFFGADFILARQEYFSSAAI